MRRICMTLVMVLCAVMAVAQGTTTTYTGTIKDLTGAVVTSGRITFTLNAPSGGTIPGTGSFVATTVSCLINSSGSPVASDGVSPCVITNNSALTPTGTSYTMCRQPYYTTPGSCFVTYANGGTVDITTIVPTPQTQPSYGVASVGAANNWSAKQVFNGGAQVKGGMALDDLTADKVNSTQIAGSGSNGNIQTAIANAGTAGSVEIPANYGGADTYTNPNGVRVSDKREYTKDYSTLIKYIEPWLNADGEGGDVTQFSDCIGKGACTVVFWGDSITEGLSQVAYENSWAGTMERILRSRWPGVTWNFQNLALGGRSSGNAGSATYFAAPAPDTPATGYYRAAGGTDYPWPNGSLYESITSLTQTGGVATATVASTAQMSTGEYVAIQNAADATFNSNHVQATVTGSTTFTYPCAGCGASTTGANLTQSWRDAVMATNPDAVFIAFGMNDTSASASTEAYLVAALIQWCQGFSKLPTMALVPPYTPTLYASPWSGQQTILEEFAQVNRGLAKQNGFPVIDAGRAFAVLRDGTDPVNPIFELDQYFNSYPAGWTTVSGSVSVSGSPASATPGASGWTGIKAETAQDVSLVNTFLLNGQTNVVPQVWYRVNPSNNSDGYVVELFMNSATTAHVTLYFDNTDLADSAIFGVGNSTTIRVRTIGAEHLIYVDGVKRLDIFDYNRLSPGNWGLGVVPTSGTISSSITVPLEYIGNPVGPCGSAVPMQQTTPPCAMSNVAEQMLLGLYNGGTPDYGVGTSWQKSLGGNGSVHVGVIGHSAAFMVSAQPFLALVEANLAAHQGSYYLAGSTAGITSSDGGATLQVRGGASGGQVVNAADGVVIGHWNDTTAGVSPGVLTWNYGITSSDTIYGANGVNSGAGLTAATFLQVAGGHQFTRHTLIGASITPAAVAANTCAAQSFTVSGLQAGDYVIGVVPPVITAHVNRGEAFVTGANTIAINFCADATGGTPAAGSWQFDVEQ